MSVCMDYIEAKSNGNIFSKKGKNTRALYEHQKKGNGSTGYDR